MFPNVAASQIASILQVSRRLGVPTTEQLEGQGSDQSPEWCTRAAPCDGAWGYATSTLAAAQLIDDVVDQRAERCHTVADRRT